eukprot:2384021-Rhodomonas_salina.1
MPGEGQAERRASTEQCLEREPTDARSDGRAWREPRDENVSRGVAWEEPSESAKRAERELGEIQAERESEGSRAEPHDENLGGKQGGIA